MPRSPTANHRLVICPAQEEIAESARVDLLQLQLFRASDRERPSHPSLIHRFAIRLSRQRDVIGVFVSTLDFERGHTQAHDLRNLAQRVQIAG